jgi:methylthioribose-1-phosphate isomerase
MDIRKKLGFSHIEWSGDHLDVLDQRKLPLQEEYIHITTVDGAFEAIKNLTVRGAPLIGITAAYGLCLIDEPGDVDLFHAACDKLKSARPTAVNLGWAVDRMAGVYKEKQGNPRLGQILLKEARIIHNEDAEMCRRIGIIGNSLVPENCRILTHCNAGALATGGIGTALGIVYTAFFSGKKIEVWVNETRPVLQGSRLTAWELWRAGIPHKLISDNASGSLMANDLVDLIIVGADRIAKNLDFANKIGTYNLAVLAKFHNIPFYCAAPTSTLDNSCPDGKSIEIEYRDGNEVKAIGGIEIAPADTPAHNPAFDITPHRLLTGLITEKGIITPGAK